MPLISVSIVCGARVIRPFGIVSVDGAGTLLDVYELCREGGGCGQVGSASCSDGGVGADNIDMNKVTGTVSTLPTAVFQTVPLNVLVSECIEFGKYFKFLVEMPAKEKTVVNDSFQILKFELYNGLIKFLKDRGLGWRRASLHFGEHFIGVLCDALWIVDPHRQKLSQQQCEVPSMFDAFRAFNDPRKHKHVPQKLNRDQMETISQQLFNILEQICCPLSCCPMMMSYAVEPILTKIHYVLTFVYQIVRYG